MFFYPQWIAFLTILIKEVKRTVRIWSQTLLPPVITSTLYFIIFGNVIGSRISSMHGYSYAEFISPGLIMMQVISSAYGASSSAFFSAKFQRSVEEMLVSPTALLTILLGFVISGVIRGCIVGALVTLVSLFFTHLVIYSFAMVMFVVLLSSALFATLGFINAVYAKKFDDVAIIPTFVLVPLTYLGGVFYPIALLPQFWQYLSLCNPISYIINAFRYGFLGHSGAPVTISLLVTGLLLLAVFFLAWRLLKRGVGLND